MSENSANKRNNYFNRKKHINTIRNDSYNGYRSSSASNYQRLLSNSSKTDSKNFSSQLICIIL